MKFHYLSKTNPHQLMKILKYLLFLVLLIFIGSAIYFGTKESSYEIKDALIILAPVEVVFEKVNDLKSWQQWEVWKDEDSNIVFNYAEKTSDEGASFSWNGKERGSITTTRVIPNKEIEQELTLSTSRGERKATLNWKFDEIDGNTDVTWTLKGDHSLVDKVYYSISDADFDTKMHQRKQSALEDISKDVSEDMKRYSIHVDGITQYGGGYYMYTTSVAKEAEVREKMIPMMGEVERFIARNNLNASGKPFLLYNQIDTANHTVIFSTCFPVKEQVITPQSSPIVCGFMDPIAAIKTTLKGNYEHFSEAYEKARKFMAENGYQEDPNQRIFEVYVTDPKEIANPAEWLTEIYIPLITTPEPEFEFKGM